MSAITPSDGSGPVPPPRQPAASQRDEGESVIDFGAPPGDAPRSARRRWDASGTLRGLLADRRLVPVTAALAAIALFASLISEWQVTAVDTTVFGATVAGNQPVPTDLGDFGAWAAGYLIGVFVLVTATVLVLFGPAPGRRYARLVGLSAGGVMLGLLFAVEPTLDETSRALGALVTLQLDADQIDLAPGRGIWCALVGVAAAMVALWLSVRHFPAAGTVEPAETDASAWAWRRTGDADDEMDPADEPFDLSVSSASPFTSLADDRDRATDRDDERDRHDKI
ncbi:hypothetical protein [Mangrovihabitans endophyticus]|uniref:Tryptophan-associated transmembrane protein (Trp_oprn_chp) n=1 Tax=Mangrovihabitans endophyticus TaxID=1751298 RepID=A0A8J3FNK2_9ACTN|nr:hypothetical protein [Mangrovihabitans endophyticus]GGK93752.1 hypothetical protein GCM10012284_29660 [Mangrovihabitans endophyticus]